MYIKQSIGWVCLAAGLASVSACSSNSNNKGSGGANAGAAGSMTSSSPITGVGASGHAALAGTSSIATGGTGVLKPPTGTSGTSSTVPTGGTKATAGTPATAGSSGSPMMTAAAGASGAIATAGTGTAGTAPTSGGKIPMHGPDPTDSLSGLMMGPYMVMPYTSGYPQATEYADSTIYAPTDAPPPLASVAVVPGFVSPQSSIQNWGPFLASYGIATITIGTNSPTDTPDIREVALMGALTTLRNENTRMGSPLMGKMATDVQATMGWSMGGGGTLLAANDHPDIVKVTISMCAWNPGYLYSMITSPALMFASQGDPLAGGQSQGFYASVPDSTPKMLIETPGADHFAANDPANQNGVIGRYGLAWLKVYLEGDSRYMQFLTMMPSVMTTDFETNVK